MRQTAWLAFLLFLFCPPSYGGTKEEQPDREMLRIMELLKEWEMMKHLDLMRQMDNLEQIEDLPQSESTQKGPRGKTKDAPK